MKKILIISSNRLGDCIISSGLNSFFKEKYHNSELTFVCGEVPSHLFKYCNNIDKLIVLKKRKFSFHWILLWFNIFFKKWEVSIDLRGTAINLFLFSKIKLRYKKNKDLKKIHKVIDITQNISGKILDPQIHISNKIKFSDKNLKKLKELRINHKLIMIAPTANWHGKIWPSQRYLELILKMEKQNFLKNSIFIIAGPQNEKKLITNILEYKKKNIYDLFGTSNLIEIFHIMKICDLFIGNDSGLMHMASLSNIRTVGLFGPSDKNIYGPWGTCNLAITSPRSPENLMGYKNFNSKKSGTLMLELETNKVFQQLTNFIKTNK